MEKVNSAPGQSAPQWQNWSRNIVHNAPTDGEDFYFTPTTEAELREIVLKVAAIDGATLRVSGQRHSQPALVTRDNRGDVPAQAKDYLVDMSCYVDLGANKDQNMVVDVAKKQVTVNAGVREDDLDAFLTKNNLIMKTVTAGGFFSIGGMTAVDVHGATVQESIFAETVASFSVMQADGTIRYIDADASFDNVSLLQLIRVSLGAFGIVTSMTVNVLDRPYATTLKPSRELFGPVRASNLRKTFIDRYQALLTSHDRVESFFNPYADNILSSSFLALNWDLVTDPDEKVPNVGTDPDSACELAGNGVFGAPYLQVGEEVAEWAAIAAQQASSDTAAALINWVAIKNIQSQVDAANARYSDLWLNNAARVAFMSYFVPLPGIDADGLAKAWEGLAVVRDYVIEGGNFHIAAPMEFRFVKACDAALSGTFALDPETMFINLDLICFVEEQDANTPGLKYTEALLRFFAHVERRWVELGGLPHNGKMYGFYDPTNPDEESFTQPFNASFISYTTGQRIERGAPVPAFKAYRQSVDPKGLFYNPYLQTLLG
ncbi:FAD-binding protein [Thalassomonas actiniarum]|uniref:FAD-binding protein n=1 Tax=Thalassomonas actiniarum TaxID=485447 RepID=A0AAF0C6W4_9GAMM|nr:FAD-binding protein [Thalassomonas actiniarum]WDE02535.1 FAD-binding protein [Thalassomonas actiniarum]